MIVYVYASQTDAGTEPAPRSPQEAEPDHRDTNTDSYSNSDRDSDSCRKGLSVRSLGCRDVGGGSDLWPEESRAPSWALVRLSAAMLADRGRRSVAALVRLLVPAPLRLAAASLGTLGPPPPATSGCVSVAVCAAAALSLHALRIALQALSLALLGGLVFERSSSAAGTGPPSADIFTVDMSAMSGDPDPAQAALRDAQDRCRTIRDHFWPLAEPLLRSLAPFRQWVGGGIAHLLRFMQSTGQVRSSSWLREAAAVDWRDAIASGDLRTIAQYIRGLLLWAAGVAAALHRRGARHLAAVLQLALSLTAAHRNSCRTAWVDLTGFLGSNPAAGAFLVAAFGVALIDSVLLPAVRARVRSLTVRDDEVRSTDDTDQPARHWRYAASAASAVAVLLTSSVALALLSGQGSGSSPSPVDLTSEPPVVGVVLGETSRLLKVIGLALTITRVRYA